MSLTLSIIKPDATKRNITGLINAEFESNGLKVVAQRRILLSEAQARSFYFIHKDRPFFESLVSFMTSGPVVVQVLKGENAVNKAREIMGATNPEEAASGTIRKKYGVNIEENSVHGSDSEENAEKEIAFFFSKCDIIE